MKYNGLIYMISEGFKSILKNKKSTTISLITMICAMFLFGTFFSIGENVNYVLEQVQKSQGIEVFIQNEATDEQIEQLKVKIEALNGINTMKFKSKQQALDSFKEQLKDNQELLEGYEGENNIFPASFIITLTDLELSKEIEQKINNMDYVKKITSNNDTISTLIKIAKGVRLTIGVIFIFLLVIAITIISNTIRLAVYARRKEISIMKYVGATNSFIRWPFIVEGIIIGVIAAIMTLLIVGGTYDFVVQKIEESSVLQKMGIILLQFNDIIRSIAIVYSTLGIGIGIIGSSISMKKYLDV